MNVIVLVIVLVVVLMLLLYAIQLASSRMPEPFALLLQILLIVLFAVYLLHVVGLLTPLRLP